MGKKRKFTTVAIIMILLLILAFVFTYKAVSSMFHKCMMDYAWNKIVELGPQSNKQSTYIFAHEKHRDSLVKLGYFERKNFPLIHITYPSVESRMLWEELGAAFPNHTTCVMEGYEEETPDQIIVWDIPSKLPQWESIIQAHDSPPTNTIKLSKSANPNNFSPFLGHWSDPNDNECYIISEASDGSFKLEARSNETWRTVLKSITFNGLTLTFDKFFYTEPSDDYKTIVTPSGRHPFSGVRNKIELASNPDNPDELFATYSTFYMPEPIEGTLKKFK